jgi:hypothetical protein
MSGFAGGAECVNLARIRPRCHPWKDIESACAASRVSTAATQEESRPIARWIGKNVIHLIHEIRLYKTENSIKRNNRLMETKYEAWLRPKSGKTPQERDVRQWHRYC